MAVILRTLEGENIPQHLRKPALEKLYEVEAHDGTKTYVESELEAAALVKTLHEDDREAAQ